MPWDPFEEVDLFGVPLGAPVKVMRGAVSDYPTNPGTFAGRLGVLQFEGIMGGQVYQVPRLEAWYGSRPYSFGGRIVLPLGPMPTILMDVKHTVEALTHEVFDSCFVNYYRDGQDCISWHADDDSWIGPVIASVSIGATRRFHLRKKADHTTVIRGEMRHGDIVLMTSGCQRDWEHSVPRERAKRAPRLNLTFRQTRIGSL